MKPASIQPDAPLILVVDDDPVVRLLLRRVMEHEGYQVAEALNGAECVSCVEQLRPDLVLLDALMPVMDGFEACATIQSMPNGVDLPLLMITSLDDSESVDRAFAVGATDYLTKPIHWAVLRQRVRRLLGIRRTTLAYDEARDRMDAILQSSNDAIVMFDLQGRLVQANHAFSKFFGLDLEQSTGLTGERIASQIAQYVSGPARFISTIQHLFADPHIEEHGDLELHRPLWRMLSWYSGPVRTRDGTVLGRLFVYRDATRQREVDRLKNEFVSLVSHELRTPLTSIKGFTDLILDGIAGEVNPDVRDFLTIVQSSANRLVALVNDLLDAERMESGKVKLDLRPIELHQVVQTTADAISPLIASKQQTLRLNVPTDLPLAHADHERLTQILTNLLSNAYKYTPPGGIIEVVASVMDDPGKDHPPPEPEYGPWLMVSVTDTGIGVGPADQLHLFTRFYRVHHPLTREVGGTGLGLSIVHALVTLHGGKVWVDSALGQGSTFSFTLPTLAPSTTGTAVGNYALDAHNEMSNVAQDIRS
jgi:PAS domain S-box-containing protein